MALTATNISAQSATPNTLAITFDAPDSLAVYNFICTVGVSSSGPFFHNQYVVGSSSPHNSVTFSLLTPSTAYWVAIQAYTQAGQPYGTVAVAGSFSTASGI